MFGRHPSCFALLGLVAALCGGCASTKAASEYELVIRSAGDANGARSVYVLTRTIEAKAFGAEAYENVAAQVTSPDESVQNAVVVLPGQTRVLKLKEPEKGAVAIYALLEHPDADAWRVLLSSPAPKKVEVRVERSRICRVYKSGEACSTRRP